MSLESVVMTEYFVVVDNIADWQPFYPSKDVITFDEYLHLTLAKGTRVRVINLCRTYRYLSTGYYCALLAEARGHHVFPSVATINDLERKDLAKLQFSSLQEMLKKSKFEHPETEVTFRSWFGNCSEAELSKLSEILFEQFPCPLLEVRLVYKEYWQIRSIRPISIRNLHRHEQESFALTFEKFSRKLWRKPKSRKIYRYDLAILTDPNEELPPSNTRALKMFENAAKRLGIATERISKKDMVRLPEYDALFIRETTAVDHHTYRFAKKAEAEDMVVFDDSASILRCSNKIYLADLLKNRKIATPNTFVLNQPNEDRLNRLCQELDFPMVLKVPDGSFSRGVIKVDNYNSLKNGVKQLLQSSTLLIAQEFLYTTYDWRIGILDNKPLYACRYYMVRKHWQIYQHGKTTKSGGFDTLPTFEVPKTVLDAAVKATKLIGNGLYGVDVKQTEDRVVVIEVNDNPNIDAGIEDAYLGEKLYEEVMAVFLRRMEIRGR